MRLDENTVTAYSPPKPGGERLLVGKSPDIHRPEFRCKQFASRLPTLKTISVPALPMTADRTAFDNWSVNWFASAKCNANFLASESKDANASELNV